MGEKELMRTEASGAGETGGETPGVISMGQGWEQSHRESTLLPTEGDVCLWLPSSHLMGLFYLRYLIKSSQQPCFHMGRLKHKAL